MSFPNKQSKFQINTNVSNMVYTSVNYGQNSAFFNYIFKNFNQNTHLAYYLPNCAQMHETSKKITVLICAFEKW